MSEQAGTSITGAGGIPSAGGLIPSQAIGSSSSYNHKNKGKRGDNGDNNDATANSNDARRSRRRNRRNNRKSKSSVGDNDNDGSGDGANINNSKKNGGGNGNEKDPTTSNVIDDTVKRKRNRRRNRKKKPDAASTANSNPDADVNPNVNDVPNGNDNQNTNDGDGNGKKKRRDDRRKQTQKRRKDNKKYPWRKHIPPGTVDPISLEPLDTLPYPPFALMIDGSTPIPIWPIPNGDNYGNDHKNGDDDGNNKKKNESGYDDTTMLEKQSSLEEQRENKNNGSEREVQLLSEQWGDFHLLSNDKKKNSTALTDDIAADTPSSSEGLSKKPTDEDDTKPKHKILQSHQSKTQPQHFHLFDGKVLALYLVSELQFIDPLNRRDLTRDEVANLDAYLKRHRLKNMAVLSAYDDKGISVSTAGAVGQTREGRLRIRQEQARQLLNSLFSDGNAGRNGGTVGAERERRRQIRREQRRRNNQLPQQQQQDHLAENLGANRSVDVTSYHPHGAYDQTEVYGWMDEEGIYGHDGGGMVIIDDDLNPGLRGRGLDHPSGSSMMEIQQQQQQYQGSNTNWGSRYGYNSRNRVDAFPALPSASLSSTSATQTDASGTIDNTKSRADARGAKPTKPATTSKSLSKIGNLVKKTNPKELEKQRKAREAALRQAEIANMPFEEVVRRMQMGENAPTMGASGLMPVPPMPPTSIVTDGQLERNRKVASALGVAPATVRAKQLNSGWTRPTSFPSEMDEFGNELNTTQYPDDLIIEAREQMTELLRLEKKWITFLKDDKAASCPLKPMARPIRKFVHAYSDFWNLHTQSFDPEPRRYIHCVKLLETRAPKPLLSQAVRSWRGPTPPSVPMGAKLPVSALEQTAGEDTASSGREFPLEDERAPLLLAPRTVMEAGITAPPGAMFDMATVDPSMSIPATNFDAKGPASASQEAAPRFATMLAERERPRLDLDPRTIPLELPKYEPLPSINPEEMGKNSAMKRNGVVERKKAEEKKKQSILAAAFASDDEEEEESSDSEWEVEEPLYSGSDSESD